MAKKAPTDTKPGSPRNKTAQADAGEDWESDAGDGLDFEDERWLSITAKEKERSRIQRQMRARRELERRREEKHLRELVEDWSFED